MISVLFSIIYLAKTSGIGLDEIFFGKKITGVQVQGFIYLAIAQFSAALAQIRYSDAATFDRKLSDILQTPYGTKGGMTSLYPNQREWFAPTLSILSNEARGWHRFLFWLAAAPSLLLSIVVFTLPVICGFWFLGNPLNLVFSTQPDPGLTLIAVGTAINLIWLIQAISLVSFLESAGAEKDEDCLSRRRGE